MARESLIGFLLLFWCACDNAPAPATPTAHKKIINGDTFIVVPAGTYTVGRNEYVQNPLRTIKLDSFAICDHEVTNKQFAAFVQATNFRTDAERNGSGKTFHEGMIDWQWEDEKGAYWRFPFGPDGPCADSLPDHPVTQISRNDAEAYCRYAGARLPSAEEWEVAARAGVTSSYPWGSELHPAGKSRANTWEGDSHRSNTRRDGYVYTAPVKSYPPNAWGMYDVIGNVFEYCTGDRGGEMRDTLHRFTIGRGGSWWCSEQTCSSYNLYSIGRMTRNGSLANQGFRVVKK